MQPVVQIRWLGLVEKRGQIARLSGDKEPGREAASLLLALGQLAQQQQQQNYAAARGTCKPGTTADAAHIASKARRFYTVL